MPASGRTEGRKTIDVRSDTDLLKTLGFCFYKLGQKKEALDSLNAALRLNSGLADVKALIAEVEKSLK